MKEKILAIIPARAGSIGLPDKNIKLLNGKPLISYTIETAIESNIFSKIHVSTDSLKYADISKFYGADVSFLRPSRLAQSESKAVDVIQWVLEQFYEEKYTAFMILQPTSPLRNSKDIIQSYELFKKKKAKAVVSVCTVDHSPLWYNTLDEDGSLEGFISTSIKNKNRQELNTYYRINGAIYLTDIAFFLEDSHYYRKGAYAYIMPRERSFDIDDRLDFEIAEYFMKKRNKR